MLGSCGGSRLPICLAPLAYGIYLALKMVYLARMIGNPSMCEASREKALGDLASPGVRA
jgi:hypothetical protein